MHSGFYDTPLNDKKDLLILRLFCSVQALLYLFLISTILSIPIGAVIFGKQFKYIIEKKELELHMICGIISFILMIAIVWIYKWYPIIDREDELKLN